MPRKVIHSKSGPVRRRRRQYGPSGDIIASVRRPFRRSISDPVVRSDPSSVIRRPIRRRPPLVVPPPAYPVSIPPGMDLAELGVWNVIREYLPTQLATIVASYLPFAR